MNENNKNNKEGFGLGDLVGWAVPIFLIFTGFAAPVGVIMLIVKLVKLGKKQDAKRRQASQQTQQASWSERQRWNAQQQQQQQRQAAQQQTAQRPAPQQSAPQTAAPVRAQQPTVSNERLERDRRSAKTLAVLLTLLAVVLAAIGAVSLFGVIRDTFWFGFSRGIITDLMRGASCIIGAGLIFGVRGFWKRRNSLRQKYVALIGVRDIMPISSIVSGIGRADKRVRRELQDMIDNGFFAQGAYIDAELDCLVFSAEAAKAARMGRDNAANQAKAEAQVGSESEYMRILKELRSLNDTIEDDSISDTIDRIEATSAKIFKIVEENPAKLPQIRRFMNYYLPTTLKLLRSYAVLEKQGISGDNITSSRENIDRILKTLATGYEQQLDQLFRSDAIDITSDINVLENMMAQDGLSSAGPLSQPFGAAAQVLEEER
jgi:hypothetical protein